MDADNEVVIYLDHNDEFEKSNFKEVNWRHRREEI